MQDFQLEVQSWMTTCFGEEISKDKIERCYRFIEEANELVQSIGMSKEDVLKIVDYTFSRPVGDASQEVGGVMVTLAALCNTQDISIETEAKKEITRVWNKIDKIREKQKNKPVNSPLAESMPIDLHEKKIFYSLSDNVDVRGFITGLSGIEHWIKGDEDNEEQIDFLEKEYIIKPILMSEDEYSKLPEFQG